MQQHIIVCEGQSERAYLQRLQSFLDKQSDDLPVPLQFIAKMSKNADGTGKGGGFYINVARCFRKQRKENRHTNINVWVDHDIYFRSSSAEAANLRNYQEKPAGIPDFLFSFHNFEDFLVLHLDEKTVTRWHAAFDATKHASSPLHSEDYTPLFETVMPGYRKGDLSPDFITRESLLRLKDNLANPLIPPPADRRFPSFAQFLITEIGRAFPALLVP